MLFIFGNVQVVWLEAMDTLYYSNMLLELNLERKDTDSIW